MRAPRARIEGNMFYHIKFISINQPFEVDRTLKAGAGGKRGRPVGRQMAWLAFGLNPDVVTNQEGHKIIRDAIGEEDCFLERVAGRQALQDMADGGNEIAAAILAAENPPGGPEPAVAR